MAESPRPGLIRAIGLLGPVVIAAQLWACSATAALLEGFPGGDALAAATVWQPAWPHLVGAALLTAALLLGRSGSFPWLGLVGLPLVAQGASGLLSRGEGVTGPVLWAAWGAGGARLLWGLCLIGAAYLALRDRPR